MKNKKMLAILAALTITVSGVSVNGADFSDGAVGSAQEEETEKMPDKDENADSEEQGEDFAFQPVENDEFSEDEISVFTDAGEDAKAAGNADVSQLSDGTGEEKENSEEEKESEGLEYEYLPETDSYRVTKGINAETVIILSEYNGKAVTEIGEGAFSGCDKIQKVFFKGTAMQHITIRQNAFENCVNLIEVYADSHVWNIESNAFTNCPRLDRVGDYMMPYQRDDGGMIADDAFDPDSRVVVTGVGSLPYRKGGYPFYYADIEKQEHLDGEDGMTYLEWGIQDGIDKAHAGYRIISCDNEKEKVKVTGNVRNIIGVGRKAFYGNEKIKVLNLGENVKYIETEAFYCCKNLQEIYIPSATKEIAEDAFDGCYSLTIYTPEGSYAEKYAYMHDIPVINGTLQERMEDAKIKFRVKRASKYSNVIVLNWSKISFAEGYQIQVKDNKTGKFRTKKIIKDGDICKYTDTRESYPQQKEIVFRIRAYYKGENNRNIYSEYKTATINLWPKQPQICSVTKKSKGRAVLKWKKLSGVSGYQILRSDSGKKFKCVKTIKNANTVKFVDTGLEKGIQYRYAITSYKTDSKRKEIYSEMNIASLQY